MTTRPAKQSGPVSLLDAGVTIATGKVVHGSARLTATFAKIGRHSVIARFKVAGTKKWRYSMPVTVVVTGRPGGGGYGGGGGNGGGPSGVSETIETTVVSGTLTLSVVDNPKVRLPNPVLDSTGATLDTSGQINTITVTDTRTNSPGFTVSGLVSDFTDGAKPVPDLINGYDLAWTPIVIDSAPGLSIKPGSVVAPAAGLSPGSVPTSAAVGLKSTRTLAVAAPGSSGTAHLGALLKLRAPAATVPGDYSATLTITAI